MNTYKRYTEKWVTRIHISMVDPNPSIYFTFQANENFTTVYSAGRDQRVWATDIRNPDIRTLICEEKAPVLKLELQPDQNNIWVATTDSTIKCWVGDHDDIITFILSCMAAVDSSLTFNTGMILYC